MMMNTEEQERIDRFEKLRSELTGLDDEAPKTRLWELCHQIMEPVAELARTHTTPSIERSMLLRMGVDSVTTHAVAENVLNAGLLGKGAGHAVLRLSGRDGANIRAAAAAIADGPAMMAGPFGEKRA